MEWSSQRFIYLPVSLTEPPNLIMVHLNGTCNKTPQLKFMFVIILQWKTKHVHVHSVALRTTKHHHGNCAVEMMLTCKAVPQSQPVTHCWCASVCSSRLLSQIWHTHRHTEKREREERGERERENTITVWYQLGKNSQRTCQSHISPKAKGNVLHKENNLFLGPISYFYIVDLLWQLKTFLPQIISTVFTNLDSIIL